MPANFESIEEVLKNKKAAITRENPSNVTATIANGASLSNAIDIGSSSMQSIFMPAAWTAAVMYFAAAPTSGGTFVPVQDVNGSEVPCTVAVDTTCPLPVELAGYRFIKLRSGPSGAAQAQGQAVIVTVILKG